MVVEMLLEAGASHCQPHSNANSPLGDAFLYRHPKVVEILLQHGASIVESQTYLTCRFGIRPLFAMASGPKKAVDLLWDQRSIVLTSAAARGLQKCPGQLTDLRKEDVLLGTWDGRTLVKTQTVYTCAKNTLDAGLHWLPWSELVRSEEFHFCFI